MVDRLFSYYNSDLDNTVGQKDCAYTRISINFNLLWPTDSIVAKSNLDSVKGRNSEALRDRKRSEVWSTLYRNLSWPFLQKSTDVALFTSEKR